MPNARPSLTAREGSTHRQIRIVLFGGFGSLLLLMAALGLSAISFLDRIATRDEAIRHDYVNRDRALETLRSNIYVSGTSLRDFLSDTDERLAADHRRQFEQRRAQVESEMADYQGFVEPDQSDAFQQFKNELNAYFAAAEPALEWNAKDRRARGYRFMQEQFMPRRMFTLGLVDRIQQLNQKQLESSSEAVSVMLASFHTKLIALLLLTVLIGLTLAGGALWRLLRLENESRDRFREVLHAREELKRLSAELVSAQENERRRISRELHDEVGQVLSAIVFGIGNLRSALAHDDKNEALQQLQLVQEMTERNVNVVRNISLLLRPAMLDDLGLVPALRWLAREVSRNSTVSVEVSVESFPDDLPEEHRTCVFRVVQEAVRNASRHSGAGNVRIDVIQDEQDRIRVSVRDDGKGFAASEEQGLGILGMRERVTRLGGELDVQSEPGRGAVVSFTLPVPVHSSKTQTSQKADYEIKPLRTA